MPKAGAFDKAKVKKSGGGFGASKAGRFDGPKESCDYAPSASAYNVGEFGTIGSGVRRSKTQAAYRKSAGGFGSTAKRGSAINGQRNDAPGPGAYADGIKVGFSKPKKKSSTSSWGTTAQHELAAATPSAFTPAPGEYDTPTGIDIAKPQFGKSHGFGSSKRFEEIKEVVQADYDVAGAFDAENRPKSASQMHGMGFGGRAPRLSDGKASRDAPGPGAYAYAAPGAFAASVTNKAPSSAFASRSSQHASNPSEQNTSTGPAVGAYDMRAYDPHAKRDFRSDALLGVRAPGGFGSTAMRASAKEPSATPGPGEYHAGASPPKPGGRPSSAFASSTAQRGANPQPSYGAPGQFVPEGMGDAKARGKPNMGFGGASRGLAADEASEVAALREMLAR